MHQRWLLSKAEQPELGWHAKLEREPSVMRNFQARASLEASGVGASTHCSAALPQANSTCAASPCQQTYETAQRTFCNISGEDYLASNTGFATQDRAFHPKYACD